MYYSAVNEDRRKVFIDSDKQYGANDFALIRRNKEYQIEIAKIIGMSDTKPNVEYLYEAVGIIDLGYKEYDDIFNKKYTKPELHFIPEGIYADIVHGFTMNLLQLQRLCINSSDEITIIEYSDKSYITPFENVYKFWVEEGHIEGPCIHYELYNKYYSICYNTYDASNIYDNRKWYAPFIEVNNNHYENIKNLKNLQLSGEDIYNQIVKYYKQLSEDLNTNMKVVSVGRHDFKTSNIDYEIEDFSAWYGSEIDKDISEYKNRDGYNLIIYQVEVNTHKPITNDMFNEWEDYKDIVNSYYVTLYSFDILIIENSDTKDIVYVNYINNINE